MATNSNVTNSSDSPSCPPYEPDSSTEQVFKSIAYFIVMFGSLIGNVLVICVVVMNRQMRTITNYLIVNMAVADLLITLVSMSVTVKAILTGRGIEWSDGVLYDILCKIIPFSQSLSIASSVLSLTVIAVDRFLAVMYPLKRYMTFQISYGEMALVWIVGIAVNSPTLYAQKVVMFKEEGRASWSCIEEWEPAFSTEEASKDFTIVLFVIFYLVPLLTMSVLYSFVVHKLWVRKVPGNQTAQNQQRSLKLKKKVLKMLLTVVILFALCWLPLFVTQFIWFFGQKDFPCGPPGTLVFMGYFLGHANSATNPAIYAIFNSDFRRGFKDLLLCYCCRANTLPRIAPQVNACRRVVPQTNMRSRRAEIGRDNADDNEWSDGVRPLSYRGNISLSVEGGRCDEASRDIATATTSL